MAAPDADALARFTSYGFVLSSILRVDGLEEFSNSSDMYRWKLRDVQARMRHQVYQDDSTFLRDVQMLVQCISNTSLREKVTSTVTSAMVSVGLGDTLPQSYLPTSNPRNIRCRFAHSGSNAHAPVENDATNDIYSCLQRGIQLSLKRKADRAMALQESLQVLDALDSPPPLDLTKAHPSLLKRANSAAAMKLKREAVKKEGKKPSETPVRDGRKERVPLEPWITDRETLQLLRPRRKKVQTALCPHLEGMHVTLFSVKRDRLVSEEPLGQLRDGQVVDLGSERTLTMERFFASHVKSNRRGCNAIEHICLHPAMHSIDKHLLTCEFYEGDASMADDVESSDVGTDEDVPLSLLLEKVHAVTADTTAADDVAESKKPKKSATTRHAMEEKENGKHNRGSLKRSASTEKAPAPRPLREAADLRSQQKKKTKHGDKRRPAEEPEPRRAALRSGSRAESAAKDAKKLTRRKLKLRE
ncbi:Aste57867_10635 [Aphanomyces stellatus]|uniref:Aste57867_10635 protein n=1 Tax=Aphanomyces stellatus TaxID=120398 RepID=A0A485KQW6_9STRA|nr:hypothetical protein As57867_010595 [Aphanomyces stellatus]VFT87507.1 Aste57867_10635 [Aphanomyces stellatus]